MNLLGALLLVLATASATTPNPPPTGLRADGTNLLDASLPQYAIGRALPKLEWTPIVAARRGAAQATYTVTVQEVRPRGERRLAWASGVTSSAVPSCVPEVPLVSGTLYEWTVAVTDDAGVPSAVAAPARFRVSLLPADDLWANVPWVGSDTLNVYRTTVYNRNEYPAILYICGLG
jgi:hypothetical protein